MPAKVTNTVAMADQEHVARRPADEGRDHFGASGWRERLQRAPQIALGVDQEGRRGDDLLALAHAFQDLDVAVAARGRA